MELILNESRHIYISKINEVQDYIESHLEDELCIQQLAYVASFSEYHFQRIFNLKVNILNMNILVQMK